MIVEYVGPPRKNDQGELILEQGKRYVVVTLMSDGSSFIYTNVNEKDYSFGVVEYVKFDEVIYVDSKIPDHWQVRFYSTGYPDFYVCQNLFFNYEFISEYNYNTEEEMNTDGQYETVSQKILLDCVDNVLEFHKLKKSERPRKKPTEEELRKIERDAEFEAELEEYVRLAEEAEKGKTERDANNVTT
ncbi:hypothetical protein AGMMS49949_03390 [Alphaproteobacteria bacterium]|nr:hypothetical protein AGMMS49949_03390 [Alphaproteobacteria bacterium]GHS96332.1 hypothetical protein AGMMS50296_2370 [Alphaproteobacteria bacterium]